MFNIVDYPPGLGECSFCKKHTCGTKEDGTQLWLHSPIELHVGNDLTIGYQCAKMIMDGFGLTVEVREKEVLLTPTDEQIGDYVRKAVNSMMPSAPETLIGEEQTNRQIDFMDGKHWTTPRDFKNPNEMNKDDLKAWFKTLNIPFVPQWGEERMREEAIKAMNIEVKQMKQDLLKNL